MMDRRVARATHPIINAWRCEVNGAVQQGSDDNGESAAGGRLAHLLQLMVCPPRRIAHATILLTPEIRRGCVVFWWW